MLRTSAREVEEFSDRTLDSDMSSANTQTRVSFAEPAAESHGSVRSYPRGLAKRGACKVLSPWCSLLLHTIS